MSYIAHKIKVYSRHIFLFEKQTHKDIYSLKRINNGLKKIDITFCFCRDTIIHDPRMTLGSYVKGPNNIICRVWARKA